MRALTVAPGTAGSLRLADLPDPEPRPGELLVEGLAVEALRRADKGWSDGTLTLDRGR